MQMPTDEPPGVKHDLETLEVELSAQIPPDLLGKVIELEYRRQRYALAASVFFAIVGLILLLVGISGSIGWAFEGYGVKTNLTNAAPGVLVLLIAGFILVFSRPSVKLVLSTKNRDQSKRKEQ